MNYSEKLDTLLKSKDIKPELQEAYDDIKDLLIREDTIVEVTERLHIMNHIIVLYVGIMLNLTVNIARNVGLEWVGRYCGMNEIFYSQIKERITK